MKIKIYGILCHECHQYLLKISKWSDFYLWRYGSIYMCTLISVVKCIYKQSGKHLWILIIWLHQMPADLDLQHFQNRINLGLTGQRLRHYWILFIPGLFMYPYKYRFIILWKLLSEGGANCPLLLICSSLCLSRNSCLKNFSTTTDGISTKLHVNLYYQELRKR